MEEAKIIITKNEEGVVTIEGENVSLLDRVVMCHAMVKEVANQAKTSFNAVLAILMSVNEKWEKKEETGILS